MKKSTGFFGFLFFIIIYTSVGFELGKTSWEEFRNDTSPKELNLLEKSKRIVLFPVRYHDWDKRHQQKVGDDSLSVEGENIRNYEVFIMFTWPFMLIPIATGILQIVIFCLLKIAENTGFYLMGIFLLFTFFKILKESRWSITNLRLITSLGKRGFEEKMVIGDVYGEIRILSGLLVPKCDSDTLDIVMALRRQAKEIFESYNEIKMSFHDAKKSLMDIIDELLVVGDILKAIDRRISYYDFLGIKPKRNLNGEIKMGHRKIIAVVHPDKHGGNDDNFSLLASRVGEAYRYLSNPHLKEIYDRQLGLK